MTASPKIRRGIVTIGVILSIVAGMISIEAAAALTAAAAPPPAPPVSLSELQDALAAEQARGDELQAELAELTELTASLGTALAGTRDYISTQGKTAKQLERELKAAAAKLAKLQKLLDKASARLIALRRAAAKAASGGGGGGTSSGGGGSTAKATPKPATGGGGEDGGGGGTTSLSLTLSISSGNVRASWSACTVSGFTGYALVRSTDSEIHFPPEDRDTEVARVTSRSATDSGAPSGRMTYKVYCLVRHDNETKVAGGSSARQIVVP